MNTRHIFDNMYITIFLCPRGCNREGKSTLRAGQGDHVSCSECGWWGWFKPQQVTIEDVINVLSGG